MSFFEKFKRLQDEKSQTARKYVHNANKSVLLKNELSQNQENSQLNNHSESDKKK
jgi:hypothetical protein